jgi:hypothetical protein
MAIERDSEWPEEAFPYLQWGMYNQYKYSPLGCRSPKRKVREATPRGVSIGPFLLEYAGCAESEIPL